MVAPAGFAFTNATRPRPAARRGARSSPRAADCNHLKQAGTNTGDSSHNPLTATFAHVCVRSPALTVPRVLHRVALRRIYSRVSICNYIFNVFTLYRRTMMCTLSCQHLRIYSRVNIRTMSYSTVAQLQSLALAREYDRHTLRHVVSTSSSMPDSTNEDARHISSGDAWGAKHIRGRSFCKAGVAFTRFSLELCRVPASMLARGRSLLLIVRAKRLCRRCVGRGVRGRYFRGGQHGHLSRPFLRRTRRSVRCASHCACQATLPAMCGAWRSRAPFPWRSAYGHLSRPILRRTRRMDTRPRPRTFAGAHFASQAWPLVRCVWHRPRTSRAVAGARCAWVALHFRMCVAGMWCKRRHIRLVYKVFGATRVWRYKVVRHCMV